MLPLLAVPVLHSSGAFIAYSGSGYLAGNPSKLSIGLMISGARNCQSWVSDVLIEAKINQ